MHVCFLTGEYPTKGISQGGVGSFVYTLAHKLVENKVSVTVIGLYSIDREKTEVEDGIRIIRLPLSTRRWASFIPNTQMMRNKLIEICKSDNPIDILEGPELSFAFMRGKMSFKKVIRMHGGHHFFAVTLGKKPTIWRGWQEKQSFKNADCVCAVSDYVAQTTKDLLHLTCPITTIYNPIELNEFYQTDPTKAVRHSVLFVGTVCEKKGVRQLILSLQYLIDKYPDIQLNIAGRDWHSKEIPSYIGMLQKEMPAELLQHVTFIGSVEHNYIPKLIETAQICVYPSLMESFGIAWIEALAMGKPLVGSKIGPAYEIFKEGETGLLCDPYSPESISEKIAYFFDNETVAAEMGLKARKNIINRFGVDQLVQENIAFYKSCLNK